MVDKANRDKRIKNAKVIRDLLKTDVTSYTNPYSFFELGLVVFLVIFSLIVIVFFILSADVFGGVSALEKAYQQKQKIYQEQMEIFRNNKLLSLLSDDALEQLKLIITQWPRGLFKKYQDKYNKIEPWSLVNSFSYLRQLDQLFGYNPETLNDFENFIRYGELIKKFLNIFFRAIKTGENLERWKDVFSRSQVEEDIISVLNLSNTILQDSPPVSNRILIFLLNNILYSKQLILESWIYLTNLIRKPFSYIHQIILLVSYFFIMATVLLISSLFIRIWQEFAFRTYKKETTSDKFLTFSELFASQLNKGILNYTPIISSMITNMKKSLKYNQRPLKNLEPDTIYQFLDSMIEEV